MVVDKNMYMSSYPEKLSKTVSGFDRKNLSALLIIGFGLVMMGGYGASQVSSGYDVSIGSNGIEMGTGTLDVLGNDIESSGTTIWDASNSYIPAAQINDGDGSGLDADTLDGNSPSQIQSGTTASDVGLGSVLNKEQLATDGSNSMTSTLDASGEDIIARRILRTDTSFADDTNSITFDDGGGGDVNIYGKDGSDTDVGIDANGNIFLTGDDDESSGTKAGITISDTLELQGDANSADSCEVTDPADINCDGSKNWIHDLGNGSEAVYSSQESPQVRAVFEGKAHIVDTKKIKLPEHFSMTVSDSKPMLRAQVTPQGTVAAVGILEKTDDYIKIGVSKETDVNFRITGIREGYEDKQVVRPKTG